MNVQLECDVTEYHVYPNEDNEKNIFYFHKEAMVINFVNDSEDILSQSEISAEDALRLAKLILHLYT